VCLIALLLPACASESPPFPPELGFVTVDPVPSSPATGHMFYVLRSADSDPGSKPVFVFFNGGPGIPTTTNLLVNATGPEQVVLDATGTGTIVENAASFTKLGNLLYIDERQTGFSYDDAPGYPCTFDMQEDSIDFTRVILRVLDTHPQLTASRVVIVGESYGGARAQLILHNLLHYTEVPEITTEVQQHLDTVFGATAVHPSDEIARQFFAQVLIQPGVMGAFQTLAPAPPRGVCHLDTRLTSADCDNLYTRTMEMFGDPIQSTKLLGARLEDLADLRGPARHGARCPGSFDDPTVVLDAALVQRLGPLDPGDSYFGYNGHGSGSNGSWQTDTTLVPTAFVDNLSHVRTLITNATFDGIVDTTAIAPALVAFGVPATLDQAPRSDVERPGWIDVTLPGGGSATIRLPAYPAGHMVTATDAADLRTDTVDWLGL
jgi:hypothetical protein